RLVYEILPTTFATARGRLGAGLGRRRPCRAPGPLHCLLARYLSWLAGGDADTLQCLALHSGRPLERGEEKVAQFSRHTCALAARYWLRSAVTYPLFKELSNDQQEHRMSLVRRYGAGCRQLLCRDLPG